MFWVINSNLEPPTYNVRLDSDKNEKTNYRHDSEFSKNLQKYCKIMENRYKKGKDSWKLRSAIHGLWRKREGNLCLKLVVNMIFFQDK